MALSLKTGLQGVSFVGLAAAVAFGCSSSTTTPSGGGAVTKDGGGVQKVDSGGATGGNDSGDDSSTGDDGGLDCTQPLTVPPFTYNKSKGAETPVPGACTPTEIMTLATDCEGDPNTGALSAQCTTDQGTISMGCKTCAFSNSTDPKWGAIVSSLADDGGALNGVLSTINVPGCLDIVTGIPGCGDEYFETYDCLYAACQLNSDPDDDACENASTSDIQACFSAAQMGTCMNHITITSACDTAIHTTYLKQVENLCFGELIDGGANADFPLYESELQTFCGTGAGTTPDAGTSGGTDAGHDANTSTDANAAADSSG